MRAPGILKGGHEITVPTAHDTPRERRGDLWIKHSEDETGVSPGIAASTGAGWQPRMRHPHIGNAGRWYWALSRELLAEALD
jgi:hypothetical protein